jgi:hypothetical protein
MVLRPQKVAATYRCDLGLVIEVWGRESGVDNVRIRSAGSMPLEFPLFMVEADEADAGGVLPYDVRAEFATSRIPDAIIMHSHKGSKRHRVRVV